MIRNMIVGTAVLIGALGWVADTQAQVFIRAPFVRVQVGGDGVEVSVAQLGLAKGRHDGDAVTDRVLDEVGCQVGSLFEEGGEGAFILGGQGAGPWSFRAGAVTHRAGVLKLKVAVWGAGGWRYRLTRPGDVLGGVGGVRGGGGGVRGGVGAT